MNDQRPERVIVLIIDGLHWQAPDLLKMPVFQSLVSRGTYIRKSHMILPHHPTVGEYGRMHTSSFPNPVLQEGTLFISPGNRMLQEMFQDSQVTAFITNTMAYASVSRRFHTLVQEPDASDADVLQRSLAVIEQQDPVYTRIHLQTPGNEGRYLSYTNPDASYYRNIFGTGSPYASAIEQADVLLGQLMKALERTGKLSSTLLIVTSDHGQSRQGWHPIIDEDSVMTPLVMVGPSIAGKRELPYFEHTDLTPTICGLMNTQFVNKNGGCGVFVRQVLQSAPAEGFSHPRYIETINRQLNRYNALRARIMIAGEKDVYYSSLITYLENELLTPEPFYHQDRFLEWSKAGNTAHLIEANARILHQMEVELGNI